MISRSCGLLLVFLGACARHVPMPLTASQLAERKTGKTLAAYLSQRDASSAVCDLNARGPHLSAINADVRDHLMDGLRAGGIAPALWRQCVDRLVESADPESGALLLDAIAHSYGELVADNKVESNPVAEQQLSTLHALLVDRSGDVAPHSNVMTRLLADLRAAIAKKRLGPVGQRYATELIADVELTPSQRAEARRRLVRLHIQQSPYRQVHENAASVEEAVLRVGSNPVATAAHRLLRGWIDASDSEGRTVVVRQDLDHQTSTLLGAVDDQGGVSVLPQLSLRGALHFELDGIDRPVTLCAPPEELDPSPCVPASEVRLDSQFAYFEPDGAIRFVEHLTARDALTLARSGERLVVAVIANGQRVAALDWGLRFETPNDLVLGGGAYGAAGPDLRVHIEPLAGGRLSYAVSGSDRQYVAIVERDQTNDFHVVSRGGDGNRGSDGASGSDGLTGLSGTNASCPSFQASDGGRGGDGSPGADGDAGGAGGNGGNILVEVAAAGRRYEELRALVQKTVVSRGGSGGAGGSGGRGGRGGAGGTAGQGATCVDADGKITNLSGGSQGMSGSDARDGSSGMAGSDGQAGRVTVRVIE